MEKENIREKEEMFIKFTDKALINMLLYNNNILSDNKKELIPLKLFIRTNADMFFYYNSPS